MANAYVDNLVARDSLKAEAPSTYEVTGLVRSGAARLKDSKNDGLSLKSRFDLAYNDAHAFSLAALRIAGYRSINRYLVSQCLEHTLGLPSENTGAYSIKRIARETSQNTKVSLMSTEV